MFNQLDSEIQDQIKELLRSDDFKSAKIVYDENIQKLASINPKKFAKSEPKVRNLL